MEKIIGARGTGKTRELIQAAAASDGIIVCADESKMLDKIYRLGIVGVRVLSYNAFINGELPDDAENPETYYIDDIEEMLAEMVGGKKENIGGFTVCTGE